jgi:multidrug resistance efflux pump
MTIETVQTSPATDPKPSAPVVDVTPPSVKMVKESDVIAVKEGAKKRQEEMQTEFSQKEEEYKRQISASQDEALKASAAVKQLEERIEELSKSSISSEDMEKVKTELAAAQKSSKEMEDRLLESQRKSIASLGIPKEKLEGKTKEQLDLIEDALKSAGKTAPTSRFDVGGAGITTTPMTTLEKCKEEMKLATRVGGTLSDKD